MIGALLPALTDPAPVMEPLKAAMEQELERIFRLLKLRFPHQDLHSAYVGVQSTNPVVHDNALEFLENILSPQLRTQLVPLLDSAVPTRERVALAHQMLSARPPTPTEAVRMLLQSDDPWMKSCGVYAIGALGLKALLPELAALEAAQDPLLREAVKQARAKVLGGARRVSDPQPHAARVGPSPHITEVRAGHRVVPVARPILVTLNPSTYSPSVASFLRRNVFSTRKSSPLRLGVRREPTGSAGKVAKMGVVTRATRVQWVPLCQRNTPEVVKPPSHGARYDPSALNSL